MQYTKNRPILGLVPVVSIKNRGCSAFLWPMTAFIQRSRSEVLGHGGMAGSFRPQAADQIGLDRKPKKAMNSRAPPVSYKAIRLQRRGELKRKNRRTLSIRLSSF